MGSPPRAFLGISIHAPREGSDVSYICTGLGLNISIHAPREGSDLPPIVMEDELPKFLSTLPARGATVADTLDQVAAPAISIHAPREGSDPHRHLPARTDTPFLSTLPARGATIRDMI